MSSKVYHSLYDLWKGIFYQLITNYIFDITVKIAKMGTLKMPVK